MIVDTLADISQKLIRFIEPFDTLLRKKQTVVNMQREITPPQGEGSQLVIVSVGLFYSQLTLIPTLDESNIQNLSVFRSLFIHVGEDKMDHSRPHCGLCHEYSHLLNATYRRRRATDLIDVIVLEQPIGCIQLPGNL